MKKIVVEGAPGSGKSILLKGSTRKNVDENYPGCLKQRGYKIVPESGPIAVERVMKEFGVLDKDKIFGEIIKEEVKKFNSLNKADEEPIFFDRGLLGYLPISIVHSKTIMPDVFYETCRRLRFDDPIIVLEPVSALDLSKPADNSQSYAQGVFGWDERVQIHQLIIEFYKLLGHRIVVVPEKPVESNNLNDILDARTDLILKACEDFRG